MQEKIKKIAIALTIALLFTIFVFAMTNAIYEKPEWSDFCDETRVGRLPDPRVECPKLIEYPDCRGKIDYTYDNDGCPIEAICNTCNIGYDDAREKHSLVLFIVSSIAGVMAVLFGLYYSKKDKFFELVKSGFLIGGLVSIFIGTMIYYDDMGRFLRPAIILIELIIVLAVTKKVVSKK